MLRKRVLLPRQVGGTRVHITPRAMVTKSGIPCAGNGLFLCQEVPRAGLLLAEYTGDIISIYDADHLLAMVRSRRCPGCCSIYLYIVCHLQDKASHVIRIGDSIWCFNSQTSLKNPMQWFVDQVSVAGFANTKPKRSDCNARFVTVGDRVFLVSTKPIRSGCEVFAFYKRLDNKTVA